MQLKIIFKNESFSNREPSSENVLSCGTGGAASGDLSTEEHDCCRMLLCYCLLHSPQRCAMACPHVEKKCHQNVAENNRSNSSEILIKPHF